MQCNEAHPDLKIRYKQWRRNKGDAIGRETSNSSLEQYWCSIRPYILEHMTDDVWRSPMDIFSADLILAHCRAGEVLADTQYGRCKALLSFCRFLEENSADDLAAEFTKARRTVQECTEKLRQRVPRRSSARTRPRNLLAAILDNLPHTENRDGYREV